MSPEIKELTEQYFIKQATRFLTEFGEFYPFAATINLNNEMEPVGVSFNDDDYPDAEDVVTEFENTLKAQFNNKAILSAAICTDITFTSDDDEEEEIDALHIRYQNSARDSVDVFVTYAIDEENTIFFSEPFEEEGTLDLFN